MKIPTKALAQAMPAATSLTGSAPAAPSSPDGCGTATLDRGTAAVPGATPTGQDDTGGDGMLDMIGKIIDMLKQSQDQLLQNDAAHQGDDGSPSQSPSQAPQPQTPQMPQLPQMPGQQAQGPQGAQCAQGAQGAQGGPKQYSPDELDALSTLSRHEGSFSKHGTHLDDMAKMANDPKTPPDLKKAIQTVQSDPGLQADLDGNGDGKISSKDIKRMANDPQVIDYNRQKADSYAQNYIPSGDDGKTTQGRPITKEDAEQELYKYSDSLHKNTSLGDLQKIVDGTGGESKAPPQVIAAAKYFTDHPDEWKDLNGGKDKVSTAKMEDNISAKGELTQDERSAVDRITADPNKAFGNKITRGSLQKIVADPKADPADKKAAQTFLDDPVIFGKEDNGKNGRDIHGIKKLWQQSDDGTISREDINAFNKKLKDTQVFTPPAPKPAQGPQTEADRKATADMLSGEADQPDQKKAKGGGFKKFLDGALKVLSKIEDVVSNVLDKLGKLDIPGLSQLAKAGSFVTKGISEGEHIGSVAIEGGDVKKAGKQAGFDMAGNAVDQVTNSSVGSTTMGIAKNAVVGS